MKNGITNDESKSIEEFIKKTIKTNIIVPKPDKSC